MAPRSLFRRPDESSSSEDSASEHGQETVAPTTEDNILARINSLESGTPGVSGVSPSGEPYGVPSSDGHAELPVAPSTIDKSPSYDHFRDMLLHTLLEDKVLEDTAKRFGKDKSNPDIRQMAKATYQQLAVQLSGDHPYANDQMAHVRALTQNGISRAIDAQLTNLSKEANAVGTAAAAGTSQALVPRPMLVDDNGPNIQSIAARLDMTLGLRTPIPLYLHGLDGLDTDKYRREYVEIEMVGKGGYGKVYKVRHKLDNSFYAMKRITFSPNKMRSIAEQGGGGHAEAMDSMLKEVRSLAKLNHVNIVRYYYAWLEYSAEGVTIAQQGQDPSEVSCKSTTTSAYGAAYPAPDQSSNIGFVFAEDSDAGTGTGAGADEITDEINDLPTSQSKGKRKDRRTSEATLNSISSMKSRKSAEVEDGVKSEDDVELIPRSHSPTFEESSGFFTNSDLSNVPNHLVMPHHVGSCLTLNIQMSLYNSNLSAFLSPERLGPTHCYHTCMSLELLSSILSGVEYLHSEGVVHRDLKPANIFLSLSSRHLQPHGSVNLASCHDCPQRECQYVTPTIGDFGLVAALGDTATRAVGTEFYRPPLGGSINEKLDVYALGVIAFELLQQFGTRMERIEALQKLRQCELPEGFAERIGGDLGKRVENMLLGMVHADEEMRWGCEQAKEEIKAILRHYHA